MSRTGNSWKPSSEELQVLRACLVEDGLFQEELRSLERSYPLIGLNSASKRLLPFLYSRIEDLGASFTQLKILKGVYLHNWAADQLFRSQGVAWLLNSNMETDSFLLVKGVALKHSIYKENPSHRPCSDVDVLVHPRNVVRFANNLESQGFKWKSLYPQWFAYKYKKSFSFILDQIDIDLNQDIYEFGLSPNLVDEIFARRVPMTIEGKSFWTMCPTDTLIHTLLHGFAWNPEPTSRWVLDASLLIRSKEIDWDLFLQVVLANGVKVPVLQQLIFLTLELSNQIPEYVIRDLQKDSFKFKPALIAFHLQEKSRFFRRIQRILYMDLLSRRSFTRHTTISRFGFMEVLKDNFKLALQALKSEVNEGR